MYSKKKWAQLVLEFQAKEEALLQVKGNDYTTDDRDQLLNFNEVAVAEGQGRRPMDIAWTLLLKHMHAIKLAVHTQRYIWAWENPQGEQLKQRIADARNYLLLLAACIDEQEEQKIDWGSGGND